MVETAVDTDTLLAVVVVAAVDEASFVVIVVVACVVTALVLTVLVEVVNVEKVSIIQLFNSQISISDKSSGRFGFVDTFEMAVVAVVAVEMVALADVDPADIIVSAVEVIVGVVLAVFCLD